MMTAEYTLSQFWSCFHILCDYGVSSCDYPEQRPGKEDRTE